MPPFTAQYHATNYTATGIVEYYFEDDVFALENYTAVTGADAFSGDLKNYALYKDNTTL